MVVLSSIAATCLLWIAVALCTKPEPEEKLLAFYKEARPMGWWGPIAQKAGVETGGGAPIMHGLGLALLGAVAVGGGHYRLFGVLRGALDRGVGRRVGGAGARSSVARGVRSIYAPSGRGRGVKVQASVALTR